MLQYLILKKLDQQERQLGESLDYVRYILRTSRRLFFKFAKVFSMVNCRRSLPLEAGHVAGLVAARDEDCGTCVQIGLNIAHHEGVPDEIMQAALDGCPDRLSRELADVYHFVEAVVSASGAEAPFRERIVKRWGDEALVEMSLVIASSRVFPIVKRTLGYAKSCSVVRPRVGGSSAPVSV
jgi:hypothetical protein